MADLEIKIYYDPICSWCYIGHKTLTKAIELYQRTYPGGSSDTITYTLLPFEIRPDLDPNASSIPRNEAIALRNGEERLNAIRTRLQRVGRGVGIEFCSNSKVGNTRNAHRLIQFTEPERRKELLDALYAMHFEQDGDINSFADLTKAAASVGMDQGQVSSFLHSGEGMDEVARLIAKARSKDGVTSVPTVEIGGRRIEGAEDFSDFYEALVAAKEVGDGEVQ